MSQTKQVLLCVLLLAVVSSLEVHAFLLPIWNERIEITTLTTFFPSGPVVWQNKRRGNILLFEKKKSDGIEEAPSSDLQEQSKDGGDDKVVAVGSAEYYKGFVERTPQQDARRGERVTGDAVLGPTFRLAAQASAVMVFLVLIFLASNGIIGF